MYSSKNYTKDSSTVENQQFKELIAILKSKFFAGKIIDKESLKDWYEKLVEYQPPLENYDSWF